MTADELGAGTGRHWTGEELHALPVGSVVGYGRGITARKIDTGWLVFEDDRPGLRVSSLEPSRVTGVIEHPRPHPLGGWYRPDADPPPAGLVERSQDEVRRLLSRGVSTAGVRDRLARTKPPLGVIPRRIHDQRRLADLDRALVEYSAAGLPADPEWGRERDDLLAVPGQRGLTVAAYARARQAGKVREATEVAADAIDRVVARAVALDCGVLLVRNDRSLLAYVDSRIPAGQLVEHTDPLPEGGVEALLASLYPPAGPRAGADSGHVPGCFVRGPIRHCVEGCSWVDDGRERMEG